MIDGWWISCKIALIWMSLDFTDDQSTLVQVMAWCRQATSHYLSQCWPRYMSPYGVTRPQWVKYLYGCHRGCLNNPIFLNLGLCAECWTHFTCHHELWPTSVGHPFSFLSSSWGLTGEKHYQKFTIAIFRFVLQNFTIPGYFPYFLFDSCLFSLLSSGLFVIAACGSISVQGTS